MIQIIIGFQSRPASFSFFGVDLNNLRLSKWYYPIIEYIFSYFMSQVGVFGWVLGSGFGWDFGGVRD